MGAGKSTALAAARAAGLETIEVDELMEADLGMPIEQAFEKGGEEAFRAREAEVVGALLEQADGGAIALGGGNVLSERVRAALDRHLVVWLQVGPAEAWRRVGGDENRPLARDQTAFNALLAERTPLYEELADAILPAGEESFPDGETSVVDFALPAVRRLAELPAGTRLLWATSSGGSYPIYVGPRPVRRRAVALGGAAFLRCRYDRCGALCRPPLPGYGHDRDRARRGGKDVGRSRAGVERPCTRRDDP